MLKEGKDPLESSSYRPICLLSTLSKTLERIIAELMHAHINDTGCIAPEQFGFMRNRSTEDAIQFIIKRIRTSLPMNTYTVGVLLDIAGAFDNIKWKVVHQELRAKNFPLIILNIMQDYLRNRTAVSEDCSISLTYGCPQGSVLGPMLWIISYDHIIEALQTPKRTVGCYADDTVMLVSANKIDEIQKLVAESISVAAVLMEKAGLSLNPGKTEVIVFPGGGGNRTLGKKYNFQALNRTYESKLAVKYLGAFNQHFTYLADKCNKLLPKLLSVCQNVCGYSNETRKLMLDATIREHLPIRMHIILPPCVGKPQIN